MGAKLGWLRLLLIILVVLLSLIAGSYVLLIWQGDRWLRPIIAQELQQRLVPRVSLGSPLQWQLWPVPALTLHDSVLLSEDNTVLLAIEEAAFVPDVPALLEGRVALRSIDVNGVTVTVARLADGAWNVMRWLRRVDEQESEDNAEIPVIQRITLQRMTVNVAQPWPMTMRIPSFVAEPVSVGQPGRLAAAVQIYGPNARENPDSSKAVIVEATITAGYQWRPEYIEFDGLSLQGSATPPGNTDWRLSPGKIDIANVHWGFGGGSAIAGFTLQGKVALPNGEITLAGGFGQMAGEQEQWQILSPFLSVQGDYRQSPVAVGLAAVSADVAGDNWRVSGASLEAAARQKNVAMQFAALLEASGGLSSDADEVHLAVNRGEMKLRRGEGAETLLAATLQGQGTLHPQQQRVAGEAVGSIDASRFNAEWQIDWRKTIPVHLRASLDKFDADHYVAVFSSEKSEESVDLTAWRQWPADISVSVGELHLRGFTAHDAHVELAHDQ